MKLLLYCVKSKPYLYREDDDTFKLENKQLNEDTNEYKKYYGLNNGKIVAECGFEVEEITSVDNGYWGNYTPQNELAEKSCLNYENLSDYLKGNNGYAIHIKNLNIFDKPRELNEYTIRKPKAYETMTCDSCTENIDCKQCSYNYEYQEVMKAPQNMMKVCEWDLKDYILISIRPEWLVKILNGEKTIEIRKKVLKEMI